MTKSKIVLLSVILSLMGCPGDSSWQFTDSGTQIDSSSCLIPSAFLATDPLNCGDCNNVCDPDLTDRCHQGECSCGENEGCLSPQECRLGTCIDPDPRGRNCEFDHQCSSNFFCIGGHCTRVSCTEEICDGYDNDCDDLIDETEEELPLARWCPEGIDRETLLPPCSLGQQFCVLGEWSDCLGGNPPISEFGTLACDTYDNNCDGCIDGNLIGGVCVPTINRTYDVVFAFDMSSSLIEEQETMLNVIEMFLDRFGSEDFLFGLVLFPSLEDEYAPELRLDLSRIDELRRVISEIRGTFHGMFEPSYDTIYMLGVGELEVSWRPDSTRIIILISDEKGQSWRGATVWGFGDPLGGEIDPEKMCEALTHGETVLVFEDPMHLDDFRMCAQVEPITTDAVAMADRTAEVIADPCLGD